MPSVGCVAVGSVGPVLYVGSADSVGSISSVEPIPEPQTVLRWTPSHLPHWRPVTHRTV